MPSLRAGSPLLFLKKYRNGKRALQDEKQGLTARPPPSPRVCSGEPVWSSARKGPHMRLYGGGGGTDLQWVAALRRRDLLGSALQKGSQEAAGVRGEQKHLVAIIRVAKAGSSRPFSPRSWSLALHRPQDRGDRGELCRGQEDPVLEPLSIVCPGRNRGSSAAAGRGGAALSYRTKPKKPPAAVSPGGGRLSSRGGGTAGSAARGLRLDSVRKALRREQRGVQDCVHVSSLPPSSLQPGELCVLTLTPTPKFISAQKTLV